MGNAMKIAHGQNLTNLRYLTYTEIYRLPFLQMMPNGGYFSRFLAQNWKDIVANASFFSQLNFRGIQLHRKEIYTALSLIISVFLFAILVNDFIAILSVETPENNSHSFTFLILVS
jgi:hypothetical protein